MGPVPGTRAPLHAPTHLPRTRVPPHRTRHPAWHHLYGHPARLAELAVLGGFFLVTLNVALCVTAGPFVARLAARKDTKALAAL